MHPALAVLAVNFGPDVIFCIPNPSDSATNGAAEHGKAVCPFSNAATSSLKQDERIVVSREALEWLAVLVAALVKLDSASATSWLVG
jgi:hypothetical protein